MWKWLAIICVVGVTSVNAIDVLAFSGSTREDSTNKKLLMEAAAIATEMGAHVTVIDLRDYPMPFYDEDLERAHQVPESVGKFRALLQENQVIFIASPNYNGSFSGVLKNALDWASRSEDGQEARDVFKGKQFAIMSASPGKTGGVKGLPHLRAVLENLKGHVITQQLGIPQSDGAFDAEGKLINPELRSQLRALVEAALK